MEPEVSLPHLQAPPLPTPILSQINPLPASLSTSWRPKTQIVLRYTVVHFGFRKYT